MPSINAHVQIDKQTKRRLGLGCLIFLAYLSTFILYPSLEIPQVRRLNSSEDTRPFIYTFFHAAGLEDEIKQRAGLEDWMAAWSEAGWQPIVLGLEDAKRHKDYQKWTDAFDKAEYKVDTYQRMCFYRWLAMVEVGGGWMADIDALPLNSNPEADGVTLPNGGELSSYFRHVPFLVSGSQYEYDRISKAMFYSYNMHSKEFWSDMLALYELHVYMDNYHFLEEAIGIGHFYKNELDAGGKESIVDPYDLASKCELAKGKRAVHFSHADCFIVGFCRHDRESASKQWIQAFREKCT